jgi:hypothetical protein
VVEDAETFIRKLGGGRKSPKLKDDPATPGDESQGSAGSSSASQMSYDNQVGNFYPGYRETRNPGLSYATR